MTHDFTNLPAEKSRLTAIEMIGLLTGQGMNLTAPLTDRDVAKLTLKIRNDLADNATETLIAIGAFSAHVTKILAYYFDQILKVRIAPLPKRHTKDAAFAMNRTFIIEA